MKTLSTTAAMLAAFGGVGAAWGGAAAAQAPAYEVVRMGDSQLSCQDLVTQVNALTAEVDAVRSTAASEAAQQQQRAQARAEGGRTARRLALGGLAGGLAYVPFGGGLASFAVRSAAVNAASAAANAPEVVQIDAATPSAAAEPPQAKRLAHLNSILQRKSC